MQITSSKSFNAFLDPSRKELKKRRRRKRGKRGGRKTRSPKSHDDLVSPEIGSSSSSYSAEIVGTNQDLLKLIFTYLGKRHRLRFTIVCKSWYQLIQGKKFVLELPPPSALLIRRYTRRTGSSSLHPKIKYITVRLDKQKPQCEPQPSFFLESKEPSFFLESKDLRANGIRISQSCNGLLLCPVYVAVKKRKISSSPNPRNANVDHYICNPTTKKYRLIPLPGGVTEVTAMNLAFDPSNSPHYKIVSLSRVSNPFCSFTQIDIYSSETGCWNVSKAEFPRHCDHVDFSQGVFLNGAIHWPSYTGETSVSFEVETECFKVLSMPPVQGGQLRRTIRFFGEAGGRLLLIDFHEPVTKIFDVFVLEDNSKWSVRQHVDLSRLRILRFHILSVIYEDDKDNLSLVIYIPGRDKFDNGLMIYNFKEQRTRKLRPPVPTWDLRLFEEEGFLAVHPLISTRFAV